MSTDLTRTLADMARPLSTPPIAPPSLARTKAREIIDANPGTTLVEIVALAYLEGRIEGINEVRKISAEVFDAQPAEYDCICQRCGRRDGSRFSRARPVKGYFDTLCNGCSSTERQP